MRLFDKLKSHRWDLGLLFFDDPSTFLKGDWKIFYVKDWDKSRWFADPFVLDVTPLEVVLLVEEFSYRIGKGRIAKIVVDRQSMEVKDVKIVLELPTHLSFPAILRKDGEVYIYPENSASGMHSIYCLVGDSLQKTGILSDYPLTDAVILESGARMLSTMLPDPNGKCLTILSKRNGKYQPESKVQFDEHIARNAGDIIKISGRYVRPAQISDGGYGYGLGISFQEMEEHTDSMHFRELLRKYPPAGYDGMHTFNWYKGVAAIDLRKYNYPVVRKILHKIKHFGK